MPLFGGRGEPKGPPPSEQTAPPDFSGSVEGVGVPQQIAESTKRLFDRQFGLPHVRRPKKWSDEGLAFEVVTPSSSLFEKNRQLGPFRESYAANAELETHDLKGQIKAAFSDGREVGAVNIVISPYSARVTINDGPKVVGSKSDSRVVLENLDAMKRQFSALHQRVAPTALGWLEKQGGGIERREEKAEVDKIQASDGEELEKWVRQAFKYGVAEDIRKWFAKAKPEERAFAKAALVAVSQDYGDLSRSKRFLQNPFESGDIISFGAVYFPGSVCEVLAEEPAIRVRADLESGILKDKLTRLLLGEEITTRRVASWREVTDFTIDLPRGLGNIVREDDGSIVFDLKTVGTDKIGLVVGSIQSALWWLDSLTGSYLRQETDLAFGPPAENLPPPTYPLLKPATRMLLGEKADMERYPKAVREAADDWEKRGWVMTTLIGPTGSGKTFLGRQISRDLIFKAEGYPYRPEAQGTPRDDVLVFEFAAAPSEKEVEEAHKSGEEAVRELSRRTYTRLAEALEQFEKITAARQGKNTFFVWDNFHLIPFEVSPEIGRRLLNTADRLKALGASSERFRSPGMHISDRPVFGIYFMGERRPQIAGARAEDIYISLIQPHRYRELIVSATLEEQLEVGLKAAGDFLNSEVESRQQGLLTAFQRREKLSDEDKAQIRVINERAKGLPPFLISHFRDSLLSNELFSVLSEDPEVAAFFTNTRWDAVLRGYVALLESQIGGYLEKGESSWFAVNEEGELRLSELGEGEFRRNAARIIASEAFGALEAAHAKIGKPIRPKLNEYRKILQEYGGQAAIEVPSEELVGVVAEIVEGEPTEAAAPAAPEVLEETVQALAEVSSKEAGAIGEQIRILEERRQELAKQAEQLQGLAQDIKNYGEKEISFIGQTDLLDTLVGEDIMSRLEKGDPTIFTDDFRREISRNSELLLSVMGKVMREEGDEDQLSNNFVVLGALLRDETSWRNEAVAAVLAKNAAAQLLEALNAVDRERLRTEVERIKREFTAYQEAGAGL